MSEKNNPLAALPGYGLLAVVLSVLFGVATFRKDGEKKHEPETNRPAAELPVSGGGQPPRDFSHFLKEKRILEKGSPLKVALPDKTRFLILTLPDPLTSQLGYWYDQSIDSLTRAMGDMQYTLSDRWFPWTVVAEDKAKGKITRNGDAKTEPGVVVYSKVSDAEDHIVVLVVGENPTSGVRVKALKAALDLAALDSPGKQMIDLVGPFFTGSQPSLGLTVKEWAEKRAKDHQTPFAVRCITGTALGLKPWKDVLPEAARYFQGERIQGTQAPVELTNKAALHYLSNPGRTNPNDSLTGQPKGKVAYLVEANSGYGDAAATKAAPIPSSAKQTVPSTLVYRFPMHIGRLAGIRSKEQRERDERLGLIRPGDGQLLALDENRSGGDVVPAADETRTALIDQRLLTDYWSAIRRERVRYIFVVATDPRDVLFMLEQIQTACPDAQPVTFLAHLHYVHPDYLWFMRGVTVVGNYSLLLRAQRWQAAAANDPRRLPFPSSNAEGVYNAVLATLGHKEFMEDYLPPRFGPAGSGGPPIWVTAVGENSEFVPLTYFTNYTVPLHEQEPLDYSRFMVAPEIPTEQADDPGSPFVRGFFYLCGLVAIVVGVAAWRVGCSGWPTQTAAAGAARDGAPGLRAQYVLLVGIGGVLATLPLLLSFWPTGLGEGSQEETRRLWFAIVLLALIVGGTAATVGRQWLTTSGAFSGRPAAAQLPAILAPWQVVAFTLLIAGAAFGWLLVDHARLSSAARVLFAERAANLSSGCSPVVPALVMALGFLVYGLLGLELVRLLTGFQVAIPYPDPKNPPPWLRPNPTVVDAVYRARDATEEIDGDIPGIVGAFSDPRQRWWWGWSWLLVVLIVLGFAILVVGTIWGRPVQEWLLYGAGTTVMVLAVLLCARVLLFVWNHRGNPALGLPRPTAWLPVVLTSGACTIALLRAQQTWEGTVWNCLFATGFLALTFLTLVAGYRLYQLWKQVERITRAIMAIPMAGAFDCFPDKVAKVFGAFLLSGRRWSLDRALPEHLLDQVQDALAQPGVLADPAALRASALLATYIPPPGNNQNQLSGQQANALCGLAENLIWILEPGWAARPLIEAYGTVPAEAGTERQQSTQWRDLAEQFIAVMVVVFLSQFLTRMRYLAYMAVTTATALLLAITAYQFEPERLLMYTAVGFAAAVLWLVVWVLYRINRNELISRVTRGTPDRFQLDLAFIQNLALLVLPLLAVIVTQLAGRMRSVVEPILNWLR